MSQGQHVIETSRSHSDTPQSVGLIWTSDQPDAITSGWRNTTLPKDTHACPWRDLNPQSQQASGRKPTPLAARPLGPADKSVWISNSHIFKALNTVHYTQNSFRSFVGPIDLSLTRKTWRSRKGNSASWMFLSILRHKELVQHITWGGIAQSV